MWRIGFFFTAMFIALWKATQHIAQGVQYDPLIGEPFLAGPPPVYGPWKYPFWWFTIREYIPQLFRESYKYFLIAFFVSLVLMILAKLISKNHVSDNYGSASWADRKELSKMDLISSRGVVVGLYDAPWKKAFTGFIRAFDAIQKDKKAIAEMRFDQEQAKKREALLDQKEKLTVEGNIVALAKVQEKLDHPPKFKVPWAIRPYTTGYKKLYSIYKKIPHFYLRDNSNKHMAVIAPTRSGKGVGLIIPSLLGQWDSSTIVNDIKSENWGVTAGYRKKMGQCCIKFEPTADDGSTARWNPLDEIKLGTPKEQSMTVNIAHVLADYEGKGKLDHWGANAETVIMTVILHLSYAYYADRENYPIKPTFSTVANFLKANLVEVEVKDEETGEPVFDPETGDIKREISPKGFVDTLSALMEFEHVPEGGIEIEEWDRNANGGKGGFVTRHFDSEDLHQLYPTYTDIYNSNPHVHPLIYKNFMEITSKPANECGSIVSTANTALKEYLDPVLSENTSVSDFCIDDVMNYKKPVSLYLVTPPSDLLRLAPIFRLFFEMMVKHHAEKIGEFKNGQAQTLYKHKCLFLMDEFSSLGNLQSFAATLSYIAGYGMKVFLINQGLPQINSIYGKDNQILMNCHLQIIYAPNDNDTAQYAEGMLGKKTVRTVSSSDSGKMMGKNYSYNETGRALMAADEIKRLGEREIIVASGFSPVLTDKVKYYEDAFFTSKLCDAPLVSDVTRVDPVRLANPRREKLLAEKGKKKGRRPVFEFDPTLQDTGFRLRHPRPKFRFNPDLDSDPFSEDVPGKRRRARRSAAF